MCAESDKGQALFQRILIPLKLHSHMEMSQPKEAAHSDCTVVSAGRHRAACRAGDTVPRKGSLLTCCCLALRRQGLSWLCETCQPPAPTSAQPLTGAEVSERGFRLPLSGSHLQQEEDKFLYAEAVP